MSIDFVCLHCIFFAGSAFCGIPTFRRSCSTCKAGAHVARRVRYDPLEIRKGVDCFILQAKVRFEDSYTHCKRLHVLLIVCKMVVGLYTARAYVRLQIQIHSSDCVSIQKQRNVTIHLMKMAQTARGEKIGFCRTSM